MADTPPDDKPDAPAPGSTDTVRGALDSLREQITALDLALIKLLARRRELAIGVAETKATSGRAIRDHEREEDLLVGLIEKGKGFGLDAPYVTRVFHLIIDDSVRLQQSRLVESDDPASEAPSIRVAFQGDTGSYSQVAVQQHFASRSDRLVYLGFDAFSKAVEAVESGAADYAMLPIENTTSGGINEVYDLLMHTPLSVIGEETLQIDHCLLAPPGTAIESLERVYAHPQGFAQCSQFIAAHLRHCRQESLETAEAVRRAAEEPSKRAAAIASRQAGERYGLEPLEVAIANQRENVTRFLCVARQARRVPIPIACKTSLVMATSDAPGALVEALSLFRDAGISMAKLESRPIMGNPWEEMFYVDVEANVDAGPMRDTLRRLARVTRYLKVLGCYPSHQIRATHVAPERWVATEAGAEPAAPPVAGAPTSPALAPVRIGSTTVDAERFVVMAGPVQLDGESSARRAGEQAAKAGASALVSGLAATGLGVDTERWRRQLQWLAEAARASRLPLVATIMRVEQVAEAAATADALRIDGRHMEHLDLLRTVGRTARPVVLTRGRSSSIKDLLRALNILRSEGNRQVMLCEAGIGGLDDAHEATLDLGAVARLRHETDCPLLIEPGQALGGTATLATPLLAAGKAAGANGCLIALATGTEDRDDQALASADFAQVVADVLRR